MTREEVEQLAKAGYSFPRIADRYGKTPQWARDNVAPWPDLYEIVKANGKVRHDRQRPMPAERSSRVWRK